MIRKGENGDWIMEQSILCDEDLEEALGEQAKTLTDEQKQSIAEYIEDMFMEGCWGDALSDALHWELVITQGKEDE